MATNKTVKATPAGKLPLGHAKEAKDASTWTYKFPQSTGTDRDIGVYAQPKPNDKSADIQYATNPNTMRADEHTPGGMPAMTVSIGNKTRGPKTEGVDMRGYGAATKGIKSRGPLA
jgi:hypothetical protein